MQRSLEEMLRACGFQSLVCWRVLNDERTVQSSGRRQVSILGLLEGVK